MLLARNRNVIVKDNDELITTLKKEEIDVVILTTPERVAQKVADETRPSWCERYFKLHSCNQYAFRCASTSN